MSRRAGEIEVTVLADGDLLFLWDDRLQPLLDVGSAVIRRVGRVEPAKTEWVADLSPVRGPVLGPFRLRDEALQAEREWLARHWESLLRGSPLESRRDSR